jgi:hypothetical protein
MHFWSQRKLLLTLLAFSIVSSISCSTSPLSLTKELNSLPASALQSSLLDIPFESVAEPLEMDRREEYEFTEEHLVFVDRKKRARASFVVLTFTASRTEHELETFSAGFSGYGYGAKKIVLPILRAFSQTKEPITQVALVKEQWKRIAFDGTYLSKLYRIRGLAPKQQYFIVLFSDARKGGEVFASTLDSKHEELRISPYGPIRALLR